MPIVSWPADSRRAECAADSTLLACSLAASLPLAHACGGNAKCSTCRVLVLEGAAHLSPPTEAEREMATRLGFPEGVRLACQARIHGDVTAWRLVIDAEDEALVEGELENTGPHSLGEEQHVAILFCDIRNFTTFAESHSAYDVIHVLNRWYVRAEKVVQSANGRIDNVMGDGFLALFQEPRDAVRAALGLVAAANQMSAWVESQFGSGFRIGCGVHAGDVVLGAVGAGGARRMTVVGDAVNLAARVEAETKNAGVDVLVTAAVWERVKDQVEGGKTVDVLIKGKSGRYALHEVRVKG
ncbi:MAG: adenylate/guanylate cyclase domain-containing protein [Planctomycetota bacterium]